MAHCIRHYEEPVAGRCRNCGQIYCSRCLVFAFGPKAPPYCVGCALNASGVRVGRSTTIVADDDAQEAGPQDKRVLRAQRRAERSAARAEQKASRRRRRSGEPDPMELDEPVRPAYVPAPSKLATKTAQQTVLAELAAEHGIFDE